MKIEQAIFGEGRGGHALRLASGASRLLTELELHLDLPDTAPPGVKWSPFLRGFHFGEHYILARTFADPNANRTGFPLTHALVSPLREMSALNDLRPLLTLLIKTPQAPTELESLEVIGACEPPPNANDLALTAEALTTRGTGPVVRLGTEGFDELVVALWFRFWPELRANFAFRLSFGPSDWRDKDTPALVCSPQSLSSRWSGYRVVGQATLTRPSAIAALLIDGTAAAPVLAFAREISTRLGLDELGNLPLLQRAYELWVAPEPSLENCVTMLRLMEGLSPDPAAGEVIKQELIKRTEARLSNAAVEEIYRLRNLRMAGFRTARALWAALASWMAKNEFARSHDTALLTILGDAMSGSATVREWQDSILHGIKAAARSDSSSFAQAFWRWADLNPATLANMAIHLPDAGDLETRLVDAAPRETKREAGATLMTLAVSKSWWHLHGTAASASLPPAEALRRQLAVNPAAITPRAIKAALRRATPEQVVALALEVEDSCVMDVAAELVASDPRLLREVDLSLPSTQTVWARAIAINPEAWRGPDKPAEKFTALLQALVDDLPISQEVIAALAITPLADLGACPRRAEVWTRVPDPARKQLLSETSKGWLVRALANQEVENVEIPLENALLAKTSLETELRAAAATKPGTVIRVVSVLAQFDEYRFLPCLELFFTGRTKLTAAEAEALGYLILQRRWQRVVSRLVQLARSGRDEAKAALRACPEMVSFLTKWSLGLASTSPDTPWLILEELALELYSGGPDHEELWSRAGGKPADLQKNGSGRARWHDALSQIRRGKDPKIDKLLAEMARDFPNNDDLHRLKSSPSFQTTDR
ncbi:MAG: hypothetical protein IT581_11925 [Verrucomicrobiales bacterium]|nr:hypothetical protein [Verrucomicrobiales bacterium]